MVDDLLLDVLNAAQHKRIIFSDSSDSKFTLIFHADLSPSDAPKIRRIQTHIFERYGIHIRVVGGGSGCTRLDFECDSVESLVVVLRAIATDSDLKSLMAQFGASFRISVPGSPQSYDASDDSGLAEALTRHQRISPKPVAALLNLSDLVSRSRKLPPRETMLEVAVELRAELRIVELPTFDDMHRVRQDVTDICAAWERDDSNIQGLDARLRRLGNFIDCCGDTKYANAKTLAKQMRDILKTIQRTVRTEYAHVQ